MKPEVLKKYQPLHATIVNAPRGLESQLGRLQEARVTVEDVLFPARAARHCLVIDFANIDNFVSAVEELAAMAEGAEFDDPAAHKAYGPDIVPALGQGRGGADSMWSIEDLRAQGAGMLEQVAPYRELAKAARAAGLTP